MMTLPAIIKLGERMYDIEEFNVALRRAFRDAGLKVSSVIWDKIK